MRAKPPARTRLKRIFLVFIFLALSTGIKAQVDSLMIGLGDSSAPQQLLPEKMGFVKKAFWGEHGLMRSLKISPLTPEGRQKELHVRRTMLKAHQFMGIATVGGMLVSIYYGQQIKNGQYQYINQMDVIGFTTVGLYATTGLLQLLAPPPLIIRKSKGGWSSIKVHRTLAYVHFTGMIATPSLGVYLHRQGYDLITYHQVSAYVTTAALASAMVVMIF